MKNLPPKADPQTWANMEHLDKVRANQGEDAAVEEFRRMFAAGRTLPPIEARHREEAAAYRRWNDLPPLSKEPGSTASPKTQSESAPSSIPQPTTK